MGQSEVNRLDEAEDLVSDLEDKGAENTQLEQQRKRESKSWGQFKGPWNDIRSASVRLTGVPEEAREQGTEHPYEEIMTENSPNLTKEIDTQAQEAQRAPKKMNPQRPTPRHILIKYRRLKTRREC